MAYDKPGRALKLQQNAKTISLTKSKSLKNLEIYKKKDSYIKDIITGMTIGIQNMVGKTPEERWTTQKVISQFTMLKSLADYIETTTSIDEDFYYERINRIEEMYRDRIIFEEINSVKKLFI